MTQPQTEPRRLWLLLLLCGGLWLVLCRYLALHWAVNPQYSFGWLVPALALYLGHRRWVSRPSPGLPVNGAHWLLAVVAVAFLPTWLIAQPSPDWRLISWALGLEVVALLLAVLASTGGWAWVRHFAFSAGFILTAIPWPSDLEGPLVQALMRGVASVTVVILNFSGVPALQHGNVIEVHTGLLGIDEACSGVRSLQATLMAALFLGEMNRFPWPRRLALVILGLGVALVTNIGRTFVIAWQAADKGLEAVAQWHDPAGLTLVTVCFVLVWLVALLFGGGGVQPRPTVSHQPASRLSAAVLWTLAAWFTCVFAGTEAWFRRAAPAPDNEWSLLRPPNATDVPIEPRAAEMLQADKSEAWTWLNDDTSQWVLYSFEWKPGPGRSRGLARMHRAENSRPGVGKGVVGVRGVIRVVAQGLELPFRAYTFERGSTPVHVYFCLWENGADAGQRAAFKPPRVASIEAALRGQRGLGQRVAEFCVTGLDDSNAADVAFHREVERLLLRTPQATGTD